MVVAREETSNQNQATEEVAGQHFRLYCPQEKSGLGSLNLQAHCILALSPGLNGGRTRRNLERTV